jgi:HEAT repeat protein
LLGLAICAAAGLAPVAAQDIPIEFRMMSDPGFDVPPEMIVLPEGAIELWKRTLARPEPDLVKAAAESIIAAHEQGFEGLTACRPELIEALSSPDRHPEVVFSVCRALILLDARDAAGKLFDVSREHGSHFRQLIEPALAAWDYTPVKEVWRSRLADDQTRRRELLLACAGAGQVRDEAALSLLMDLVRSRRQTADIRLSAARAAGEIATAGLEADAADLVGLPSDVLLNTLCSVSLLQRHSSEAAQKQLIAFAGHENPTVAGPALRRLLDIDPALVLPLAATALDSHDHKVRQCGLDAYIALPTLERLPLIADVLDDPHPEVRISARQALHRFSEQEPFEPRVREECMRILARDGWRGQEQAALLLVALDHKPAAARLVELLESERPEVMIVSAWGLRRLAVPDTREAVLDKARRDTEYVLSLPQGKFRPGTDHQLGHVFEALAVMGEARAIPLMRRHIPKDIFREKSRSAAIWGLGLLLEDQPDAALALELVARIQDVNSNMPELYLVRQMSVLTIGRMNAEPFVPALQMLLGSAVDAVRIDYCAEWAVKRMNGETPPRNPPRVVVRTGWLIEPNPPE